MRVFGLDVTWRKKAAGGDLITHFPAPSAWWPIIRESFGGAWQRGVVTPVEDAMVHPTFWACVARIAADTSKVRPKLVKETDDGINVEVTKSPYSPVLDTPNHYQNRIEFFTYWIISKVTRGNAYALKERDNRGIVTALYLLDPMRVRPMVTPRGEVYYSIQQDVLAGVDEASIVVPAREIIHDKGVAPYHPLCGVSPIYAASGPIRQALTIQNNATKLFQNGSTLGGILTGPANLSEADAKKFEDYWAANYAGQENSGKVPYLGGGLKYEKPTAMTYVDSQLIEQQNWIDLKVCAVLGVPPFMVGVGPLPSYNNVEALFLIYYAQCLQSYFEALELCLTKGLELDDVGYEVEFDTDALDRMDSVQKMDAATKGVVGGVYSPNEARAKFNLKPVKGGDTPYLQQQNFSLAALDARDKAGPPPPSSTVPSPAALPAAPDGQPKPKAIDGAALLASVLKKLDTIEVAA